MSHYNHVQSQSGASKEPTLGVYVTFARKDDAAKCIQAVDGTMLDGRVLRATYGTTKYCTFFLRGLQCQNPGCMYLHEPGEDADSYTKEEMAVGKHHAKIHPSPASQHHDHPIAAPFGRHSSGGATAVMEKTPSTDSHSAQAKVRNCCL